MTSEFEPIFTDLNNMAVIKGGQPKPMDLCPNPILFPSPTAEANIPTLLQKLGTFIKDQQHTSNPLLETSRTPSELQDWHLSLLATGAIPLFCRPDMVSFGTSSDLTPPPAVEFQFRIGGQGFHSCVDQHLINSNRLAQGYACTLNKLSANKNWSTPKIAVTVPPDKSGEVQFWLNELQKLDVPGQIIPLESPSNTLSEILSLNKQGKVNILFRRELHLPLFLHNLAAGKAIVERVLSGDLWIEPPLPLIFDGKGLSIMLSELTKPNSLSSLTIDSKAVTETDTAQKLIAQKQGVLKLGSGFDLPRTFGGREVLFLDKLSQSQRQQSLERISQDLNRGHFWIWQPDIGSHFTTTTINQTSEATSQNGRVRTMIFLSLLEQKVLGGGFNFTTSSRIVRGGHAIGTILFNSC